MMRSDNVAIWFLVSLIWFGVLLGYITVGTPNDKLTVLDTKYVLDNYDNATTLLECRQAKSDLNYTQLQLSKTKASYEFCTATNTSLWANMNFGLALLAFVLGGMITALVAYLLKDRIRDEIMKEIDAKGGVKQWSRERKNV